MSSNTPTSGHSALPPTPENKSSGSPEGPESHHIPIEGLSLEEGGEVDLNRLARTRAAMPPRRTSIRIRPFGGDAEESVEEFLVHVALVAKAEEGVFTEPADRSTAKLLPLTCNLKSNACRFVRGLDPAINGDFDRLITAL